MKIFIDGFGVVAQAITRKLIENHGIDLCNIYIKTYKVPENQSYISYLDRLGLNYTTSSYASINVFKKIGELSPDYIVSLYGREIIPRNILMLSKKGAFNLHPSLLPMYKGCYSCPWVIINREKETGITIHEMVDNVDSGDILFQEIIPIDSCETAFTLYHRLANRFIDIFDDFFGAYVNNLIDSRPMDIAVQSYYKRALPFDGVIDQNWESDVIEAFIRAMNFPPYSGARMVLPSGNSIEVSTYGAYLAAMEGV